MIARRIFQCFVLAGSLSFNAYGLDDVIKPPKTSQTFSQEEVDQLKEWIKGKRQTVGIKSLGESSPLVEKFTRG